MVLYGFLKLKKESKPKNLTNSIDLNRSLDGQEIVENEPKMVNIKAQNWMIQKMKWFLEKKNVKL